MTQTVKHHLTDQLLMAYAAGNLPEAFSLVVATHVSLCDDCRAALDAHQAIGGALLDDLPEVAMNDDALAAVLSRLDDAAPDPAPTLKRKAGVFPAPLQDYVGGDADAVRWKMAGGGVKQAILSTDGKATVRLLRIPAGSAVPDHGHNGTELTLVLQGAFSDEDGYFARGDVEVATEEVEHTPVAAEGEDCICLAATDAPLRFTSWLPRIAQPFLRI